MANGARDARSLSRGEFGARVGAPRLLDLCDTFGIPSTWFVPGHTAETIADEFRQAEALRGPAA